MLDGKADKLVDRWNDTLLDGMRGRGDPPADELVAALLAGERLPAVQRLMDALVENDAVPPDALPEPLRGYFAATAPVDPGELPRIEVGEEVFAAHGPEIVTVLLCGSLPSAYGCRRGVQVLHRTAYLARRPTRRIVETAQMVVDVMTPGGLAPGGRGVRSAQKVRLMHAAIRHLILHDPRQPWDSAELGIPINQEDMAGTLMTFSAVVLDGLRALDVQLRPQEEEAYLDAWRVVGRLLGVAPELLPVNAADARALTSAIDRRQTAPSPEGREMMAALLADMENNLPPPLRGFAASLVWKLVPAPVADGLGVPRHRIEDLVVSVVAYALGEMERVVDASAQRRAALRTLGLHVMQWLLDVDRGGRRTTFALPAGLRTRWADPPNRHEPTVWQRVLERVPAFRL